VNLKFTLAREPPSQTNIPVTLLRLLGPRHHSIRLADHPSHQPLPLGLADPPPQPPTFPTLARTRVTRTRRRASQTYFVEAARADERFDAAVDELPGVRTRCTLCVPLPAAASHGNGGEGEGEGAPPVGVLQLTNKTRRRPLVAFDKELADLLACNLASSVHHIARATAAAAAAAALHAHHADMS